MQGKSQIETVVENLRSDLGLDVKLIDGTDNATVTIDATKLSVLEWAALGQSQAALNAVEFMRSADHLRARLAALRRANDLATYAGCEFQRALLGAEFARFTRAPWPRRSKPAKHAMAKLAARRGRRG